MKKILFDNEGFNSWLDKKAEGILSKEKGDSISNKEALILILKSQADHASCMSNKIEKNETSDLVKIK